ncbi:hypothetical protein I309_00968 [Cryptococcus deuterogattii LA55]|nr:hypothetical protein I309_00968 [Cryptococcus deuterogattii LA55]KIR92782.1 hypothetical protein I304_03362 [Cryptococcus deuterogattii CBS 10090]
MLSFKTLLNKTRTIFSRSRNVMARNPPERSSLDGQWEITSKSPSILYECLQAFPPLEVDVSPADCSALGLGLNSGRQTGDIRQGVKLSGKSSLRRTKHKSKDTLQSPSKGSVSTVPTSKKSFLKSIKIHRPKSKKNVDQAETLFNEAEFRQVAAAPVHTVNPKTKTCTRKHDFELFKGSLTGNHSTMSPFENTENDELVADLAPRLYFTPLPTMFQSGGRNQPIVSTVLEEGENPTILALKPTCVPLN